MAHQLTTRGAVRGEDRRVGIELREALEHRFNAVFPRRGDRIVAGPPDPESGKSIGCAVVGLRRVRPWSLAKIHSRVKPKKTLLT